MNNRRVYLYKTLSSLFLFFGFYFLIQIDYPYEFKTTVYFKILVMGIVIISFFLLVNLLKNLITMQKK